MSKIRASSVGGIWGSLVAQYMQSNSQGIRCQTIALSKGRRNNSWIGNQPEEAHARDDAPDSTTLSLFAAAGVRWEISMNEIIGAILGAMIPGVIALISKSRIQFARFYFITFGVICI